MSGKLTLISSATASSSSSVSFTSGIDSTYDEYVFYFVNLHPQTHAENFTFQVNADGGSGFNETITSTSFEAYHTESDSSAAIGYLSSYDQANGTAYQILHYSVSAGSGMDDNGLVGELHLFSPSSTSKVKHFYCTANTMVGSTQCEVFTSGYINTTSAIDEIDFKMSSGNIDAGTIYLFGVS